MTELLVVLVAGFVVIAAAAVVGPRIGVAAPLVLVAVGVAASAIPAVGGVHIEPEWILEGVLPPLLYSSAVSMPSMSFRREFGAISGLSVALVVVTSLVLGLFFMLVLPGVGFAWGVALGAVLSPTDAVATSIVKGTSVSRRVVAMLDGESLLNDATALVLLRTAIVAAAATFSFWGALGSFAYSVAVAVVVGGAVGLLGLAVRRRVGDPTANTVISFAVPFAASVPVELLHGSGLVAAVVAGLVTGFRAPRALSPENRLSDSQNWRTVELVLEGAVFLTMGVQIAGIVGDVRADRAGVGAAVLVAAAAFLLTVLVRAAYVGPLLRVLGRRSRRGARMQPRLEGMQARLATPDGQQAALRGELPRPAEEQPRAVGGRAKVLAAQAGRARVPDPSQRRRRRLPSERDLERFAVRVRRLLADIDYFRRAPLGWRDGTAVVWAGMRGAVTVAAAQTLPDAAPHRSVLVLIAFAVAAMSLLVQGGTIGPLLRRISPVVDQAAVDARTDAERTRLLTLLRDRAETVPEPPDDGSTPAPERFALRKEHRLAVLAAQRAALLDVRDDGTFDADVLEYGLANLDAEQIAIEMRGGPVR